MKTLLILASILVLSGCEQSVGTTSSGGITYDRVCIDKVEYLRAVYRIAPHFKPDGSLYTCNTLRNN